MGKRTLTDAPPDAFEGTEIEDGWTDEDFGDLPEVEGEETEDVLDQMAGGYIPEDPDEYDGGD